MREHLVEPVETPAVGHRAQVDDEAGAHQLLDRDVSEMLSGLAVVAGRVDVRPGVHVGLDEHGALAITLMRRDVGHLDRRELRPGGHAVAPRLGEIDDFQAGQRAHCASSCFSAAACRRNYSPAHCG